jgi:ribosomal protein L24
MPSVSLKSDTPQGWADYHREIAALLRSQGQASEAAKHDAVAEKYARQARRGMESTMDQDLKRGDRVRTPNGDAGTVESVASRYVVVSEDSGYTWRGLAESCHRLDAVHVPEREEQKMSISVQQVGPGYKVSCSTASEADRAEGALKQIGAKFRRYPLGGGGAEFMANGSGDKAAAALGVTNTMDLTEVCVDGQSGDVEVCVDPSGDEAMAYSVMSASTATCPYCVRSVAMERGSLGSHRAHGGVCDGAGRRVATLDRSGRATLMAISVMAISVGDTVEIKDSDSKFRGQRGKVLEVHADQGYAIVEESNGYKTRMPISAVRKAQLMASKVEASDFPLTIAYQGKRYYRTGKVGTNNPTGQPAAEYDDGDGERVWYTVTGRTFPE